MDIAREICTDSFYTVNSGLPFISFHFIHFISYSRYKKGHAHNQLYDLLGAILEEVDDICYSISKKNIMCFKGGEYNKMLKKIVTRKRGNLSLEQVVEVFLKSNFFFFYCRVV